MLNNQNLKTSPKTRKNTKYLLLVSSLIFMGMTSTAHAWAWETDEGSLSQQECDQLNTQDIPENTPGKPPEEFSNLFRETYEENDQEIDEDKPNYIALQEVKKKMQEIFGNEEWEDSPEIVSERGVWGIFGNSQNFLCTTDERIYGPSRLNAFETNAFLNTFASEPLFLENKEELSVELRPFSRIGKNPHGNKTLPYNAHQIGIILGMRKQFPTRFVSAELLYGRSYLSLRDTSDSVNDHNVMLGVTGGLFKNHISLCLTFSVGGTFSDMNKREEKRRKSHPKALLMGMSPLLVFYPPSIPIDFFLGGDLFYVHGFGFEETQKGDKYSCNLDYESSNDFLWRVKSGPSYTFKRSSTKRFYQLVFSLATNVQSASVSRVSFYPNILFESQGHKKKGGWILKLGYERAKDKGALGLAYGLRF